MTLTRNETLRNQYRNFADLNVFFIFQSFIRPTFFIMQTTLKEAKATV